MIVSRAIAFVFAALIAAAATTAQAEIKTEWIEYSHGDVKLKGYLAYDDAIAGKRPAVMVIHAREADEDVARILEEESARGAFPFLLHCFTAGPDLARRALELQLRRAVDGRAGEERAVGDQPQALGDGLLELVGALGRLFGARRQRRPLADLAEGDAAEAALRDLLEDDRGMR